MKGTNPINANCQLSPARLDNMGVHTGEAASNPHLAVHYPTGGVQQLVKFINLTNMRYYTGKNQNSCDYVQSTQ